MKPVDKASWLAALEALVEEHIQYAVQHCQNLDESTLLQPSPSGGWSIAQCLAHLNSYGHYYLPRLQQGLEMQPGTPPSDAFVSSWLGTYLSKLMDPKTSRTRFKTIKRHQPIDALNPHQVVAEFINQQEILLRLLSMARKAEVNAVRIPLSVVVWVRLPLGDILQFMVVHTKRHLLQANRNIEPV